MTTRKCEYLIGIAKLITEGKLSKESLLQTQDVKIAEKQLTAIHGIGPWTAHYVLMRCLRFPSAFPIDDVGLHNAIKYITGSESKPTKQEIKDFAANWINWESYATFICGEYYTKNQVAFLHYLVLLSLFFKSSCNFYNNLNSFFHNIYRNILKFTVIVFTTCENVWGW